MDIQKKKWGYLIALAIIWGSSFILIKKGLIGLTAMQLGALRVLFTAFFLFIMGLKTLKTIEKKDWFWIALSGLAGTFFPVFCFAYAETEIDSSIASVLNSLVPLITLLIGLLIFKIKIQAKQTLGVIVGLVGTGILIFQGANIQSDQKLFYNFLVVIASICYGINVNIIKAKLQHVKPIAIATGNFTVITIPALIVLWNSDFIPSEVLNSSLLQESILYVVILSLFGTAIAKILFNSLVQISTPVFSSSVTYLIPIVAIMWGMFDGEQFTFMQIIGAFTIFCGVYLVNTKKRSNTE